MRPHESWLHSLGVLGLILWDFPSFVSFMKDTRVFFRVSPWQVALLDIVRPLCVCVQYWHKSVFIISLSSGKCPTPDYPQGWRGGSGCSFTREKQTRFFKESYPESRAFSTSLTLPQFSDISPLTSIFPQMPFLDFNLFLERLDIT